ncbi:hypothetical protein EDD68_11346 [Melghiribacillus thermohalophilus]|uniref:Uncharacterized protein n=1 Tax=Melghiribacillus thermohalophilus TaxID=1324956 RepID=A0A4V6NZX7_9BACI|nr:hypothetical protein EDD68_11346 [Melghiribacillus thermohalophilus]
MFQTICSGHTHVPNEKEDDERLIKGIIVFSAAAMILRGTEVMGFFESVWN